ncbi:tRNA lysidine(34) synthetase TilS [Enterococcus lactis]|uniref:tRNA lysidine(34) synthetase TilS n=1 Tax=Enterococcus lactis TaxID=357441 RepID=UPI002412C2CD|nr:tRNA lysidine(34) synthetase TilS [Enterococcus lactis]
MSVEKDGKKVPLLQQSFIRHGNEQRFWQKESRILAAVSGGVDSMVLLHLLLQAQRQIGFSLGVVHINHQLREESAEEAAYLRSYCEKKNLPLYVSVWEDPAKTAIETAARNFRYQAFTRVMEEEQYDTLMTAHHGDDQIETVLMKIIRGGQLSTFSGIKEVQPFATGRLVRPLLSFSKEELYAYAAESQLVYFEDQTNQLLDVQRNRLRHLVVPQLKQENTQVMRHFQQFSQQIQWADQVIQKCMGQLIEKEVEQLKDRFQFSAEMIEKMEEAERYYFFHSFFDKVFSETGVILKEQQMTSILEQWQQKKSQWQLSIGSNWVLKREYHFVVLAKKEKQATAQTEDQRLLLIPEQGIQLNETEWIGLLKPEHSEDIKATDSLSLFSHDIWVPADVQLYVEKRKAGDRIQLTEKLTKKVSRYFIDQKVPNSQRQHAWIITDAKRNIYSLIPFAFSYLSIREETDKIHYILLYKYQKEAIGRRT